MSGTIMIGLGCGLIGLAAVLFVVSIIYRMTAGKRIRKKLRDEYE